MKLVWMLLACLLLYSCLHHPVQGKKKQHKKGKSLRELFFEDFHQRCSHFPFVNKFTQLWPTADADPATARFLIFTYQSSKLRNGGFGDRMGGLVSAVALALRFRRTLLIRGRGFAQLFRPFHPVEVNASSMSAATSQFLWHHNQVWLAFRRWQQAHPDYKKDETKYVYKLNDCVSATLEGFTEQQTYRCAMEAGDVPQPIVEFASNRAYLCLWQNASHPHSQTTIENLQLSLGLQQTDDLYQVAGCLLRLVMWPTNKLWDLVDEAYRSLALASLSSQTTAPSKRWQNRVDALLNGYTQHSRPLYQIGLHFRCGDYWSYTKQVMPGVVMDPKACLWNIEDDPNDASLTDGSVKSYYHRGGNPVYIGLCAKDLHHGKLRELLLQHRQEAQPEATIDTDGEVIFSSKREADSRWAVEDKLLRRGVLVYSTSDSVLAAAQMREYAAAIYSLNTPQGCHIDLDHSASCYQAMAVEWFILALSRSLVTQTVTAFNVPSSSFSRYAGIYGLSPYLPFFSGKYCETGPTNTTILSRVHMGNWFCAA